jgi:hypothetical protein
MKTLINAVVFVATFGIVTEVIATDTIDETANTTEVKTHITSVKPHWSDAILEDARKAGRL